MMKIYDYPSDISLRSLDTKDFNGLFYKTLRCGLAAVLAVAGLAKLIDSSELLNSLQQIPFVSSSLTIWIATLLPVVELALAGALFFSWELTATVPVTCTLFAVFLGVSIYGAVIHLTGGCGCFGNLTKSSFGWGMVLRNFILFLAAGLLWARRLRS